MPIKTYEINEFIKDALTGDFSDWKELVCIDYKQIDGSSSIVTYSEFFEEFPSLGNPFVETKFKITIERVK